MTKHPSEEVACPLAAVDRRLADAHRLWHQAEAAYFDPDEFRLAIQNAIQSLRSVTFILQHNKNNIPDFDRWYGNYVNERSGKRGKWQQFLYDDPLLRWLVEARNTIEKQGDLESNSFVRAEIVASYLDDGPTSEVPAHLFDNIKIMLDNIPENALGDHIKRNGALRIERRWVASNLPEYELLDAIAIAYGKIAELVHDAHRQIGLDPPQTIHGDDGKSYDLPSMGWRYPCMIDHQEPRALVISLADGQEVSFETKSHKIDASPENVAEIFDRYKGNPFAGLNRDPKNDFDIAETFLSAARRVFLNDGYHDSIMIFLRDHRPIKVSKIVVDTVQQKYLLMRQLATEVIKTGADAVILIGEVWTARADQLRPYERPVELQERREGLALHMASKLGEPVGFFAEISRDGDKVELGQTVVSKDMAAFEFAAFYRAWGRELPKEWLSVERAVSAAMRTES